jgi:tetratricopeptide (TPR) repeat protein
MLKKLLLIVAAAVFFAVAPLPAQQPASAPAPKPAQTTPEAQPAAKAAPQAKTREEYADYTSAAAAHGGAAMEKAAHHFAQKHPDSELRVYLYSKAMHEYLDENNSARVLEMGEKVLSLDPDNAIALVLTATALADGLSENDKDQDKKSAQIRQKCEHAQKVLAAGYVPPGATQQQVNAYLGMMRSMVHSAMGILELKLGHDPAAEKELRAATQVENAQPDPYVWYHLALALDHQKKYAEALAAVNSALRVVGTNADLEKLALGERDRLNKLTGPAASAAQPAAEPGKAPK